MAKPVTEKVFFKVTARSYDRGDHWMVKTVQTGICTYGPTREAAERRNGEANKILVRRMKQEGRRALNRFLRDRNVTFRIGGSPFRSGQTRQTRTAEDQPQAATDRDLARAA